MITYTQTYTRTREAATQLWHTERFESTTKGSTGGHSTKLPTDLLPLAEEPRLTSRISGVVLMIPMRR